MANNRQSDERLPVLRPPSSDQFESKPIRDIQQRGLELYAKSQVRARLAEKGAELVAGLSAEAVEQYSAGVAAINAAVGRHNAADRDLVEAYAQEEKLHLAATLRATVDAGTRSIIAEMNGSLNTYKDGGRFSGLLR